MPTSSSPTTKTSRGREDRLVRMVFRHGHGRSTAVVPREALCSGRQALAGLFIAYLLELKSDRSLVITFNPTVKNLCSCCLDRLVGAPCTGIVGNSSGYRLFTNTAKTDCNTKTSNESTWSREQIPKLHQLSMHM